MFSDLYELYVLDAKKVIDKLYPSPSHPIRANFVNEHREVVEAINAQEAAVERVVI